MNNNEYSVQFKVGDLFEFGHISITVMEENKNGTYNVSILEELGVDRHIGSKIDYFSGIVLEEMAAGNRWKFTPVERYLK